jgi:hypothetical protein
MDSVYIEDLHFKNIQLGNGAGDFCARSLLMKNCSFSTGVKTGSAKLISLTSAQGVSSICRFEGCVFSSVGGSSTDALIYLSRNGLGESKFSGQFTSCTFFSTTTSQTLINHSDRAPHTEIVFTNNVLIHPDATTARPSIKHATGYESSFKSQGYNIIIGQVHGTTPADETVPWKHATDQYLPVSHNHSQIVTIGQDGHHKVVVGEGGAGLAYRNLPPNPATLLPNEHFPEKDILGNAIDYTKPTHTGAYQAIDGTDLPFEALPTGITFSNSNTANLTAAGMFSETTLQLYAQVQPVSATQEVTWSVTPAGVVNISETGLITAPATSLTDNRTVTVTATANARGAGNAIITGSLTLTVKPYIHVATVSFPSDTIYLTYGYKDSIRATVEPASANNPKVGWHIPAGKPVLVSLDPNGNTNTIRFGTLIDQLGTTQVVVTSKDGARTDTVTVVVSRPDYTKGIFYLNEDWFGHTSSSINYLHPDGHWDYRAFQAANPQPANETNWFDLGITAQFGCIYGDKIYFTRKQPGKFHVTRADAHTLHANPNEPYPEYRANVPQWQLDVPASDGRAYLALSDSTGYESTSNGIIYVEFAKRRATSVGGVNGSTSSVYTSQVGTMRRVGDRVFAVHQTDGILVIDLNINAVGHTLAVHAHPTTLTQSLDGYLWTGSTLSTNFLDPLTNTLTNLNSLICIDPWTLEVKEVPLPVGVNSPATSFGAWQFDPVWASTKENKLYWTLGAGWEGSGIYQYDINTGTGKQVFSLGNYTNELGGNWKFYGTGFGVHPSSGEVYACIYKGEIGDPAWCTIKFHPDSTAKNLTDYSHVTTCHMDGYKYWYPAMPIFPDTAPPRAVAANPLPASINIPCNRSGDTLRLGDKVTDADNLDAAIVISVAEGYDKNLIHPEIWRDSLIIQRRKNVVAGAAPVSTNLTVVFNSNGRTLTHTMAVSISPDPNAPVLGALALTPGKDTLKIGVKPVVTLVPTTGYPALNWKSSNEGVAIVQPSGQVVAIAPGQTTITATHPDDVTRTATALITVIDPNQAPPVDINTLPALTLTPDKDTLKLGVKPTVTLVPTTGYPALKWSSSDESVAIVQPGGLVIALLPGQTTITATVEGSTDPLRTATALITVMVNEPDGLTPILTGDLPEGYTGGYYTLTGQWLGKDLPTRPGLYIVRLSHPALPPIVRKIFLPE